jgi:hypothetical protein
MEPVCLLACSKVPVCILWNPYVYWHVKKCLSAFYGTRMFTGMFISACLHFMEPVCLLACSKVPATCSNPEPDEINLCHPILTMLCHTCPLSSSVNAEINALCTIHDPCII